MSNNFGVNFICSGCSKSFSQCQCVSPGISTASAGLCSSCGQQFGSCLCGTVYKAVPCPKCGSLPANCICNTSINQIINTPINPIMPYSGSSTQSNIKTYDCRIFDIITKKKLDSCGHFVEDDEDDNFGMHGTMASFELPMEFESCFYHLRSDWMNLWQIRTPLTFRINIEREVKREVKFFSLVKFSGLQNYEDKLVVHDATFQEVVDNLEVTRLVEIQRVFTQLLRRI